MTTTGITIFRLEDGKIVEEWSESDMIGMLGQLGAFPVPAAGLDGSLEQIEHDPVTSVWSAPGWVAGHAADERETLGE